MIQKYSQNLLAKEKKEHWLLSLANLERLLFGVCVLLIPVQLGKHFWPPFSYIEGLPSDYLSPTLYVSDIFICVLLLVFLLRTIRFSSRNTVEIFYRKESLFVGVFIVMCVSAVFAKNSFVALYGLAKYGEFLFFGLYTALVTQKEKKLIIMSLTTGIIFSSTLGALQFLLQGSMGGLFYFFGERAFTAETPGIANVSLGGKLMLRPYAAFPHPNVLAGYLLISFLLVQILIQDTREKISKNILYVLFGFASIGILLSMTRVVWILLVFVFIAYVYRNFGKKIVFAIGVVLFGLFLVSTFKERLIISVYDESIVQRWQLLRVAWELVWTSPLLGVGLKNFILHSGDYLSFSLFRLQPVHNIYMLLLAETGILVLVCGMYFLTLTAQRVLGFAKPARITGLLIFISIGVIGFFDHYFFTLQQGGMLFSFTLGVLWSIPSPSFDTMKKT